MKKLNLRLFRIIKYSKGQFISVTVIVTVALSIFLCFTISTENINDAIDIFYEETNFAHIQIDLAKITQRGLEEIKSIKGIKEAQLRISIDVPLETGSKDEKVTIRLISIPENNIGINKLYLTGGKKIALRNDGIILLKQFALDRSFAIGDIIAPYINGRTYQMEVRDIAYSPEYVYLMESEQSLMPSSGKFGVGFVNEEFAQGIYGEKGCYNEALITLYDGADDEEVIKNLEKVLDKYRIKGITKRENQISNRMLSEKLNGFEKISKVLPILFLGVAGLVIVIVLSRMISNDRMAIGVLKALGYSSSMVLFHYLKYAVMIGVSGLVIGNILGLLLSKMLTDVFILYFNIPLIPVKIRFVYIIYSIIITVIFCVVSGFIGGRKALKIAPADAMLPEPPKSGKHIFLERVALVWKNLTFSWKLVIKNIFRNKRRFALLVLGLALAYGINTVPQYMLDAVTAMFSIQYNEYQKMDYIIEFKKPMSEKALGDLKHLVKSRDMEPRLEYPFDLKNGLKEQPANIIGVPTDTFFLEFRDTDNNKVTLSSNGIFITESLAKILDVGKGDKITIKNYLPGKKDMVVEINNVIKQYLGANAYMNLKAMQNNLAERKMITGAAAFSDKNLKEDLKDAEGISTVLAIEDIKMSFEEYLDIIVIVTRLYMLFGGILSFVLIYNSTIISLSERRMELASLRVMGFDKKDIFILMAKENIIMAIMAIILGIPFGIGMIISMAETFSSDIITFPIILTYKNFLFAGAATILFAVIAQIATWKKVRDLNFIDALKSRIS
ncbi:MAG: ABC transporter permease [Clostridiales bacterium]|nr:ABC transporter permease [Clostridiales bacterium]